MKKLVLILLVFVSVRAFAQVKKDTVNNNKMVIVNGQIFDKAVSTIPKDSILTIDSIEKNDLTRTFAHAKNGIIVIVTKDAAVSSYQQKLGAFSDSYASYLKTHGSNDGDIFYDIDGKHSSGDKMIKALYNLPAKRIKEVVFIKDYVDKGRSVKVVSVHTKKN